MSFYSQSELLRRCTTLITHGVKPDAQAHLARAGYTPDELHLGAEKIACVKKTHTARTALAAHHRKTSRAGKIAHEAVQKELNCLSETASILFSSNHPALAHLNLHPRAETLPHPHNGTAPKTSANGANLGEQLADWHALLAGAETLEELAQQELVSAGWPPARVTNATRLVESYRAVKMDHQIVQHAAESADKTYKAALKDLETWYLKAHHLCRAALQQADPANSQNLLALLALD